MASILEASGVGKSFGGLRALSDLSLGVAPGQIKAIIGPNGAGKTTFFNVVTRVYPPDAGTIKFKGVDINGLKAHDIAPLGISRTFQNIRLFGDMTALENVMVGRHSRTRSGIFTSGLRLPGMIREERAIREASMEKLDFVGLSHRANELAGSLPIGEQKFLEIARALATEPELLLLDEPVGGLSESEMEEMARLIKRIRDSGITILLVEHDMNLVMRISDEVLVLNYGRKIAEGPPREIQANKDVIAVYLGAEGTDA
ncbi:MAG: ABC transporter ATP-binding protein [bacterium]